MLGRHVLLRLRGPTRLISTHNLSPQQPLRVTWSILSQSQRFYATPGRPRSTVGEPSRTVKRAVKAKARSGTATTKAKKPAAKKKKAATKPKPKSKKQPLTPERKEANKVKELKRLALNPPKRGAVGTWQTFLGDKMRGTPGPVEGERTKELATMFKALTPAELEHYNHLAVEQNKKRAAEFATWLNSVSVEDVYKANKARIQLRRRKVRPVYYSIPDERQTKRPPGPYMLFSKERSTSGDFANIPVKERAKLIGKEWHALSVSEKRAYGFHAGAPATS